MRAPRFPVVPALALLSAALLCVAPAFSHLPQYSVPNGGGAPVMDHWDMTSPVMWQLNPNTGSNITGGGTVGNIMDASFGTWSSAPNAALRVARGADTSNTSPGFDPNSSRNINLVCFVCTGDFSSDAETLAVTITTMQDRAGASDGHGGTTHFAGQIVDADILFNPNSQFSMGASSGQDLQTVATHEIGHFFGLDHSGVVRAVMFPFAPDVQTSLGYDDVAGIAALYPKGSPDVATGVITGTVRFTNDGGVFGAHVFAQSVTNALPFPAGIRKTPIGTLTFTDGTYRITGVPPDQYIVTAEPLDDPMTASNITQYTQAFGASVQTGFTTRWH